MTVEASYFTGLGYSAADAANLAASHNEMTGSSAAGSSAPTSAHVGDLQAAGRAVPPPPLNPAHQAVVDKRVAELRALNIDEAEARAVAAEEARYQRGSADQRAAMLAESEAQRSEDAMQTAVDKSMAPPRSPHEYLLGPAGDTPEDAALDTAFRQAMFDAAIPREIGNSVAAGVEKTAQFLLKASPEQAERYMGEQEAALRRVWGSAFDARLEVFESFLRTAASRSAPLKDLLQNHPELFSKWEVADALSRVAEHQRRIATR